MATILLTDSCCDLPVEIMQRYNIEMVSLTYIVGDVERLDDLWQTQDAPSFYNQMRAGSPTKTSQVNVDKFLAIFRAAAAKGDNIIYIAFSSALSGTANAATLAQKMLQTEIPDFKLAVIDSKCASLGQGLLVYEAAKRLAAGASADDTIAWVKQSFGQINHWFTVGDLEYLKRGGRISPLAGAVGTLLQIKPVLRVDDEGRLVPWAKARGRKKALDMLCDMMSRQYDSSICQTVAISHADCLADAQSLADRIRTAMPVDEFIISQIGPVIGSHAGPETLALFFYGENRG